MATQLLTEKYAQSLDGVLGCYDRIVITGSLAELCYPKGATGHLYAHDVRIFDYPKLAEPLRGGIRTNAAQVAQAAGLTIEYISKKNFRKEDRIQVILAERGRQPGLVHIFSAMEPCPSYRPWHDKDTGHTYLQPDSGKCLHYCFYFIDAELGLYYLRVPTWCPFRLQFYCNGGARRPAAQLGVIVIRHQPPLGVRIEEASSWQYAQVAHQQDVADTPGVVGIHRVQEAPELVSCVQAPVARPDPVERDDTNLVAERSLPTLERQNMIGNGGVRGDDHVVAARRRHSGRCKAALVPDKRVARVHKFVENNVVHHIVLAERRVFVRRGSRDQTAVLNGHLQQRAEAQSARRGLVGEGPIGAKQRTAASEYTLMDPQTLTNAICKISAAALQDLFNGTIQVLAAFGVFMAEVMVAVDGTRVVTAPTFQGRGKLRVSERQRNRQGVQVEVVKFLFGWRLIALLDLRTLIPLAIQIVQIQEHEAPYLVTLVQQAQANLAPHSRISRLVIDRAYVDGASLYALHELGITFVVIAKSNMAVRAVALAEQAGTPIYERTETVRRGHGREATIEVWVSRVRMVADLRHWDAFRPPVDAERPLRWAQRPVLHAVIVNLWRNRAPEPAGERVYLTNAVVSDPWTVVDGYDDRSWIENGLFRNSKQFWRLTRWFPQKTESE